MEHLQLFFKWIICFHTVTFLSLTCFAFQNQLSKTQGNLSFLFLWFHGGGIICLYAKFSFCENPLFFPQKGCGYHLDLLMVAVMLGVCSIMGLPWFVAATVLSITHVNSLKLESECSAPGEQPKFLGIREQRVTGLMIFILMGSSVFMTSILKVIKSTFMKLREGRIYLLLFKKSHLKLSQQFANIV